MSAYIVTPSGVVAQYAEANWIKWDVHGEFVARLYAGDPDKGGKYLASAPRGSIVSFFRPLATVEPNCVEQRTLEAALEVVVACADRIAMSYSNRKALGKLKKDLQRFNSNTGKWRPE